MIKKYIKKPIVIEAVQWLGYNLIELTNFTSGKVHLNINNNLVVETKEGDMLVANIGDFIIKGIIGEYYPCDQEVFYRTYEEVI